MTGTIPEGGGLHSPPIAEAREAAQSGRPILEMRGLEKRYAGTHALKSTDLAFQAGEVHAIVGENGAGKSTLIKLLTGVITPARPPPAPRRARSSQDRHGAASPR